MYNRPKYLSIKSKQAQALEHQQPPTLVVPVTKPLQRATR